MKRCPVCSQNYSDDTLVFCLDDGTRLLQTPGVADEPPTVLGSSTATATQSIPSQSTFKGVSGEVPENADSQAVSSTGESNFQTFSFTQNSIGELPNRISTLAPIVAALAHNYWQWIYLANPNSFQFPSFLWSISFLVWLFLLVVAAAISALALRRARDKSFAVIAIIVLAINFLLCIVPRRI